MERALVQNAAAKDSVVSEEVLAAASFVTAAVEDVATKVTDVERQ